MRAATDMPDLREIERAVEGVLSQEAVELVDLEYVHESGRWVLRFFLDKPGGVTLQDCEYMSDRIGAMLDMTDLLPRSYVLEVSSPGVDRVLRKDGDFLRFLGHRVKVRLRRPMEGGRRNFTGFLRGFQEGRVSLECDGQATRFAREEIEEARLFPELEI